MTIDRGEIRDFMAKVEIEASKGKNKTIVQSTPMNYDHALAIDITVQTAKGFYRSLFMMGLTINKRFDICHHIPWDEHNRVWVLERVRKLVNAEEGEA